MMTSLIAVGVVLLLVLEGAAIAALILRTRQAVPCIALALPIAAFVNVLIVFALTVIDAPLTPLTILLPHALIGIVCLVFARRIPKEAVPIRPPVRIRKAAKAGIVFSVLILSAVTIYSFAHAVLLPTFQYDSATNWTMRSEISFVDQRMAFDRTEERGMAKPQYPFLLHALQVTANQGQQQWNDRAANLILWLLSLSAFITMFLMIADLRGRTQALFVITAIIGIPLFGIHLAQGYGDLPLAQIFLLSLLALTRAMAEGHPPVPDRTGKGRKAEWLLLSAVLVSSSVWTKSEGTFFGLLPWLLVIGWSFLRNKEDRRTAITAMIVAIVLSVPWHLFALAKGLMLTPHGTDTAFGLHLEAVPEAVRALFSRGSFGIAWYGLFVLVPLILIGAKKKNPTVDRSAIPGMVWGIIVFVEFLFVYLATPNVVFLMNAESFYRQMMIPAAMLIASLGMALRHETPETHLRSDVQSPHVGAPSRS